MFIISWGGVSGREFPVNFKFKFIILFTLIQLQYNNNKEKKKKKKTELTIHWIKHNKGKECVAAKGAKLSSWLLPQSGYKWVEVIQYL